MSAPHIKTALPCQRHQIGSFVATVLTDIDSDDPVEYRYIMAIVEDGQQQPALFVTSERNTGPGADAGRYRLRVIIMAAVKDDLALIAVAEGPFRRFTPDFGPGPPSGANLEIAMDMAKYVESFSWKGDPVR